MTVDHWATIYWHRKHGLESFPCDLFDHTRFGSVIDEQKIGLFINSKRFSLIYASITLIIEENNYKVQNVQSNLFTVYDS